MTKTITGSTSTGLRYQANADWLQLRKDGEDKGRIFHTYYRRTGRGDLAKRPLTFVFNGGPGASSAYLHVGAVGPKRVDTPADGSLPGTPVRLVENTETWLNFTDLVFVDPVGTGLSQSPKPAAAAAGDNKDAGNDGGKDGGKDSIKTKPQDDTFYWDVRTDLDSLCDFINAFLSQAGRWRSPIWLAGESYGGYRSARLVRQLQEAGVGLSGAVIISPVLEWDTIFSGRHSVYARAMSLPTQAAAARKHGRCKQAKKGEKLETFLARAEAYALTDYLPNVAAAASKTGKERQQVWADMAAWIGLPADLIERHAGRIEMGTFARELLRDQGKVLGWYDLSLATPDPFPRADTFQGVDATLGGLGRVYCTATNQHLRENLGVDTSDRYELLSMEVNRKWQWGDSVNGSPVPAGATDDMAVALAMNPAMKILVVHGIYDHVTPYFESRQLLGQLGLDSDVAKQVQSSNYEGGHMFYMWQQSRRQFTKDVAKLMA